MTACPKNRALFAAIWSTYGARVARDSAPAPASLVPETRTNPRRIAGILRWRLARDRADALSQDSSTFAANSAELEPEGGA